MDVLGADVRAAAGAVARLFERDQQLAVKLNAALRRLRDANERLTVVMPVGGVLYALAGPAGADVGLSGRPAVLDAESPVAALGGTPRRSAHRRDAPSPHRCPPRARDATIGCAMIDYQSIGDREA